MVCRVCISIPVSLEFRNKQGMPQSDLGSKLAYVFPHSWEKKAVYSHLFLEDDCRSLRHVEDQLGVGGGRPAMVARGAVEHRGAGRNR